MSKLRIFTALDFETFTAERSSACAIGLVKVVDGHIINRFYSVINPIPDNRTQDNTRIHGITREMVAVAPTFQTLWPLIKKFVGNDAIVCHNAAFDKSVWNAQLTAYGLGAPEDYHFLDKYKMTGLSLEECCTKHNIDMGVHHDALDDAMACAKVFLAENGSIQVTTFKGPISSVIKTRDSRTYDHATLAPLDDSMIENQETPFFHAKTVITGVFNYYPNRNDLGKLLQSLGADINTYISKKTDIVVVGDSAGPSKLRKIEELNADGHPIRIIYEPELLDILS